jgi:hypothetical protein
MLLSNMFPYAVFVSVAAFAMFLVFKMMLTYLPFFRKDLTDRQCLAFTLAMQQRLPREIRNMIYDNILEDETSAAIASMAYPDLSSWYPNTRPWPEPIRPHFLRMDRIAPIVIKELIETFYEGYSALEVASTAELSAFLKSEFKLGMPLNQCRISQLVVRASLDPNCSGFIKANKIRRHFMPLLDTRQSLSKNFNLIVCLEANYFGGEKKTLHRRLGMLPEVCKELLVFRKALSGKGMCRTAKVTLRVVDQFYRRNCNLLLELELQDWMAGSSKKFWAEAIYRPLP